MGGAGASACWCKQCGSGKGKGPESHRDSGHSEQSQRDTVTLLPRGPGPQTHGELTETLWGAAGEAQGGAGESWRHFGGRAGAAWAARPLCCARAAPGGTRGAEPVGLHSSTPGTAQLGGHTQRPATSPCTQAALALC